eukprot:gene14566-17214_t
MDDDSVVDIAASGHTSVVGVSGKLYTVGRNDSAGGGGHGSPPINDAGQLGRSGAVNRLLPVMGDLAGERVLATACGRYHTAGVTNKGEVFTFGLNDYGQLGRRGLMGKVSTAGCTCDSGGDCSCGATAGALAKEGEACAGGPSCRSGIPQRVLDLPTDIVAISAGRYSTVALSATGELYAWGLSACGGEYTPSELVSDYLLTMTPRLVKGSVTGLKVVGMDVGYIHMAMVTSDGGLHTCSTGFDGYAGGLVKAPVRPNKEKELGRVAATESDANTPGRVTSLQAENIRAVATGRCHTLALSQEGKVFSFGCGILGRP